MKEQLINALIVGLKEKLPEQSFSVIECEEEQESSICEELVGVSPAKDEIRHMIIKSQTQKSVGITIINIKDKNSEETYFTFAGVERGFIPFDFNILFDNYSYLLRINRNKKSQLNIYKNKLFYNIDEISAYLISKIIDWFGIEEDSK